MQDKIWVTGCRMQCRMDAGFAMWDAGWDAGWIHCEGYGMWGAGCRVCDVGRGMQDVSQIPTSTRMPKLSWRRYPCSPVGFLSMIIQSPA